MRYRYIFAFVMTAVAAITFAANKYTPQSRRVEFAKVDFTFNGGTNPTAANVHALYTVKLQHDDDANKVRRNHDDDKNLSFDGLSDANKVKTVAGVPGVGSLTYEQVFIALAKVMAAETPADP
jgi:hypothetical protein